MDGLFLSLQIIKFIAPKRAGMIVFTRQKPIWFQFTKNQIVQQP